MAKLNSLISIVEKTLKAGGFDNIMHVDSLQFFNDIAWGDGYLFQSSLGTGFNANDYAVTIWISKDMGTAVFRVSLYAPEREVHRFLASHFNAAFRAALADC